MSIEDEISTAIKTQKYKYQQDNFTNTEDESSDDDNPHVGLSSLKVTQNRYLFNCNSESRDESEVSMANNCNG